MSGWVQWLTPVIPATQDTEIRRIVVQSQPKANSSQTPILGWGGNKNSTKQGWWNGSGGKAPVSQA
jgi:hypothetical protein